MHDLRTYVTLYSSFEMLSPDDNLEHTRNAAVRQMTRDLLLVFYISYFVHIFGRPFVKQFAYAIGPLSYLSCLSVTLAYCSQTVGRIQMKLGMQVGLSLGRILLDGDLAPPHPKGQSSPNIRPISVVAKWLDGSRFHMVGRQASAQGTLC